ASFRETTNLFGGEQTTAQRNSSDAKARHCTCHQHIHDDISFHIRSMSRRKCSNRPDSTELPALVSCGRSLPRWEGLRGMPEPWLASRRIARVLQGVARHDRSGRTHV